MSSTMMTSSQMVYICFVLCSDATFELSTTFCPSMPNLRVRRREISELHLKMRFDACCENDIINYVIISSLYWQNFQILVIQLKLAINDTSWRQYLGLYVISLFNNCKISE